VAPYILKFLPLLLEPSYQSLKNNILDILHKLVGFLELTDTPAFRHFFDDCVDLLEG
jgi:hypothetical protein